MYQIFCSCLCLTFMFLGVAFFCGCLLALAETLYEKFHRKD